MNPITIFNFNKDSNIRSWKIVDDVVMGGRSHSQLLINEDGHGTFSGNVSLENNGGFSSVRHRFKSIKVHPNQTIAIKLKGDRKNYQLRIKNNSSNYYSYIKTFQTSGEWESVEISLQDMIPSFRGRYLNGPNFSHQNIEEIAFLISNKKNEAFQLIIDKVELK